MKAEYSFKKARRGAVLPQGKGKARITIRLDEEIVGWFRSRVESSGEGNYQTMINDALRSYIEHKDESLEKLLRKVVRDEIRKAS